MGAVSSNEEANRKEPQMRKSREGVGINVNGNAIETQTERSGKMRNRKWMIIGVTGLLAMQGYAQSTRTSSQDGDFGVNATWGNNAPPTGIAIVNHNVDLTDSRSLATVLRVGAAGNGVLDIKTGGSLTLDGTGGSTGRVGDGENLTGSVVLNGGSMTSPSASSIFAVGYRSIGHLTVNSGTANLGSDLTVGRQGVGVTLLSTLTGSTFTQNGGTVTVGGALAIGGGIYSGSVDIYDGTLSAAKGLILHRGEFAVHGSKATISFDKAVSTDPMRINADGTLKFVFDANGVSSLDFKDEQLAIWDGASIVIDGSAYTGTGRNILLLDAGSFDAANGRDRFSNVTITGFSFGASLEYDDVNGTLSLIPEPATLGLFFISSFSLLLWRRCNR
jgi:hypothetical protein